MSKGKMNCDEFKRERVRYYKRGQSGEYVMRQEEARLLLPRLKAHLSECGKCRMRELLMSVETCDFGGT